MQLRQLLLALSLGGSALSSYHERPLRRRDNTTASAPAPVDSKPVLNQYIIEFVEGANFVESVAEINSRPNTTVLRKFNSSVFRGVSVEATSESPESLQKSPKISNAWQSQYVKRFPTILADGVDPSNYSVHAMTKVDKLHLQGIYGKGVKIAVVDTGVDYTHPALGGGFGPKFKVAGGHDFLGDTILGEEPAKPDLDPQDSDGHGTHVAGIVAGNGNWFKGVAPEATILAYKVFGLGEYTDISILIEAFLKAYEDGADIITASIGSYDNWANNPWALVASRLVNEGVVVTIAAGNDGEEGPLRGSTGSSGLNVLAVASVDAAEMISIPITATLTETGKTETHELAFLANTYFEQFEALKTVQIWASSPNTSVANDACDPLPKKTPSLKGKVVLVRQSLVCDEAQQSRNFVDLKPAGIVFYRNLDSTVIEPLTYDAFPSGIITDKAGALLIESLARGAKVSINFAKVDKFVNFPDSLGGKGSSFTSWGGLWDLTLKPDIAAPGGSITSTYPMNNPYFNTYRTMSGTSMATPYIAGIAALYIGKFGGRAKYGKGFAKMLHARIVASGEAMQWPGNSADGLTHRASPSEVGNGLVNALKVLEYTTQLSLTKFSLNDTARFVPIQNVDITNTGTKDVTYTWDVQAAGGFDAIDLNGEWIEMNWNYQIAMYGLKPDVAFPTGVFTVKAGQTKTATFVFSQPKFPAGHKSAAIPVYSGKILISGSNLEILSVPYYGLLADVKKEIGGLGLFWKDQNFPRIDTCPLCPDLVTPAMKPYWTFETNNAAKDWPSLWVDFIWGTQELRWDIFDADWPEKSWTWPLVAKKNGYIGTATYWRGSYATTFDSTIDDAKDVVAFPDTFLNRQYAEVYIWLGQLTNGSVLAPGNYTMRVAALLPFGDRAVSKDWEIMKLPQIQIRPKKKL